MFWVLILFYIPIFFYGLYLIIVEIITTRIKYKSWRSSETLRWASSARAGGHGLVYKKDGGVSNAVSAEECQKRSDKFK